MDNTGETDVTAELQAAIEAVPDGETVSLPAGRYRVELTLDMRA